MNRFRFPLRPVAVLRAHREMCAQEAFAVSVNAFIRSEEALTAARTRAAEFEVALFAGRQHRFSPADEALRRLALYWGVMPRALQVFQNIDTLVAAVTAHLREQEMVSSGDRFVMAYGAPVGQRTPTNSIRIVEVG